MAHRVPEKTLTPASLPMAMLKIGLWEDDVSADRIRGDAVMAAMYGLSEAEAAQGLSWNRLSSLFHPDDLRAHPTPQRHVRQDGGLFVWEHRIAPAPGVVRWVLARGHFERNADGRVRGRGIVIDITDTRMDGVIDGPAQFLAAYEASGALLERIADRALELCGMIRDLEPEGAEYLRILIEALLHELGRQIAASLQESPPAAERPRGTRIH
ncbi:PAS fold-containing protein [Methylobacterium phyllostachyos]|uniref:PAS fold-containing protein n=1 Tax=Methylobacterium phyllostachyos TaxID=582672 RepID=A0A1H0KWY7_9HYPH|nr:PAS domain-containing protein [Methylobacterium phyllostachyos]SDO60283.1 PAS fold-containing protein [Methylobacterium phyllostachyos]